MSKTPVIGKRSQVVEALASAIRRGDLSHGDQLDGENELARRFDVSRGTIRQALDELKRRNLIVTRTGIGSFVAFDGVTLDQSVGWARALADVGGEVTTEILGIEALDADSPDPRIRVRRLRRLAGTPISYESSLVPATGPLAGLPTTGLLDGSLTTSLAAAGLRAARGREDASVVRLDDADAALLDRPAGTSFLRTERTSSTADGRFVEHVVALLDPDRFRLTLTFGDQQ